MVLKINFDRLCVELKDRAIALRLERHTTSAQRMDEAVIAIEELKDALDSLCRLVESYVFADEDQPAPSISDLQKECAKVAALLGNSPNRDRRYGAIR